LYSLAILLALQPGCGTADVRDELLSEIRPYLHVRLGADFLIEPDTAPNLELDEDSGNPAAGISVGADLGRYLGVEAALDYHKTGLERPVGGKLGDYSLTRATAEVRLRYPLFADRFVPYALAGAGAGYGEFSGREDFGFDGGGSDLDFIGVAGAGFDYFVVDNIALTAQAKYVFGFDPEVSDAGMDRELSGDAVELTAGLRVYADHLGRRTAGAPLPPARDSDRRRGYLALKGGRAIFTDAQTVPGVEIETVSGLFGEGGLGVNFNRHWGAEFDVNYTRAQLVSPALGDVTGYPVFTYTLLGRYRYPLLDDALVPYVVAGGGIGFGEIGDRDQPFTATQFSADQDSSAVAAFGAGFDYFIEDNFSVGIEAKYTTLFETDVAVAGVPGTLSPDFLALTAGVRIYYP
jgi:opacity protein-like surface antigen